MGITSKRSLSCPATENPIRNAVLIEQAREDAKAMHEAAKKEGTV